MGYASAMAWLMFVIIMVVTAVQFWGSKKLVYYGGDSK
jgi:multiple sugar transport system permease protein